MVDLWKYEVISRNNQYKEITSKDNVCGGPTLCSTAYSETPKTKSFNVKLEKSIVEISLTIFKSINCLKLFVTFECCAVLLIISIPVALHPKLGFGVLRSFIGLQKLDLHHKLEQQR